MSLRPVRDWNHSMNGKILYPENRFTPARERRATEIGMRSRRGQSINGRSKNTLKRTRTSRIWQSVSHWKEGLFSLSRFLSWKSLMEPYSPSLLNINPDLLLRLSWWFTHLFTVSPTDKHRQDALKYNKFRGSREFAGSSFGHIELHSCALIFLRLHLLPAEEQDIQWSGWPYKQRLRRARALLE